MATALSDLLLNDRGFAFDPASGETFQFNTTGLRVVRMLQQGLDADAAVARILDEFDVEENTAKRDIGDFLSALEQFGWKP